MPLHAKRAKRIAARERRRARTDRRDIGRAGSAADEARVSYAYVLLDRAADRSARFGQAYAHPHGCVAGSHCAAHAVFALNVAVKGTQYEPPWLESSADSTPLPVGTHAKCEGHGQ